MNTSLPPEQRDRPHLIHTIRKAAQRFQIAVYLIAIVGMAVLINSIMTGFGGSNGSSESLISIDEPTSTVTVTEPKPIDPLTPQTTDVLQLLIEDEHYLVAVGETYKSITLEEISQRIQTASGNSDGVKVIVQRKKSAREKAEQKLRELLDKLINTELQRWPAKLVE